MIKTSRHLMNNHDIMNNPVVYRPILLFTVDTHGLSFKSTLIQMTQRLTVWGIVIQIQYFVLPIPCVSIVAYL